MRITVSILSYNQVGYLAEAIDSVLGQTLRPDTIRIIDDCSTDTSRDLISAYSHQYPESVQYIFHQQNLGICASRNEAISHCESGLHTFLDGDDRFLPEKLEREHAMWQKHRPDSFVFSNINYIDDHGQFLYTWANAGADYNGDIFTKVFGRDFPRRGLFRSELVNVEAYRKVGEFNPALDAARGSMYEDYDMRIRLSKLYRAVYIDRPLSEYRIHPGGISRQKMTVLIRSLNYILEKNMDLLQGLSPSNKRSAMQGFLNNLYAMHLLAAKEALVDKDIRAGLRYLQDALGYRCKALMQRGRHDSQ